MNIIHEIINSPWFIEPNYARKLLPIADAILNGTFDKTAAQLLMQDDDSIQNGAVCFIANNTPFLSVVSEQNLIYEDQIIEPSLFVCNINGPIVKYAMCGPGMIQKARMLKLADKNPMIFAHIIKVDSGGGSGYAGMHMAETIKQLQKPVFGFVSDFGASAAYQILAPTAFIAANSPMAQVGSIGTYLIYKNNTRQLENEGIIEKEIYASKSVRKNFAYREAEKGNFDPIQKMADVFNDDFLLTIQNSRADKLKSDEWQSGDIFFAPQALQIGLIDQIIDFDQFLIQIFNEFSPSNQNL